MLSGLDNVLRLLTVRVAAGTCDIEGHRVHWSCLPVYTCNWHTNIRRDLLNTEIVVVLSFDALFAT